jgi:hypothetical protein
VSIYNRSFAGKRYLYKKVGILVGAKLLPMSVGTTRAGISIEALFFNSALYIAIATVPLINRIVPKVLKFGQLRHCIGVIYEPCCNTDITIGCSYLNNENTYYLIPTDSEGSNKDKGDSASRGILRY